MHKPHPRLATLVPYLLLLAGVLIFHRAVLFQPDRGIPWDLPGYHLPQAVFLSESLHRGEIPFWEPYAYCGRPFAANILTQTFYPARVAVALAGSPRDAAGIYYLLEWEEILHIFLAAAFAYWLASRLGVGRPAALLAGFAYSLGCFFASQAEHIGAVETAAWLPLIWGALWGLRAGYNRRDFLLLVAGLSLSLMSSFTPLTVVVFLSTLLLAACFALVRLARPALLAWTALAMALSASVCAIVLIPQAQLSMLSVARYRTDWKGTGAGVPLAALWSLIAPNHLGVFDLSTYHAPYEPTLIYLYCGIAILLLAAAALLRPSRERAPWMALLAIAAIWMLGDSTPVGVALFRLLPGLLRDAIYPQFWMAPFSLCVALLAAFGLSRRVSLPRVGYLIALLCAAELILVSSSRPLNTTDLKRNPIVTESSFEGRSDTLPLLRSLTGTANPPYRIDTIDDSIDWAMAPATTRLPIATGYDPMALIRFIQARLAVADGKRWGAYYQAQHPGSPMLAAMSVKYLLSRKPIQPPPNLRLAAGLPGRYLYENLSALPRFYFPRRVTCAAGMDESARRVRRPDWDPAGEAVVECAGAPGAAYAAGTIANIRYQSNSFSMDVSSPGEAFLATSEPHYPGWKAYIDGTEVPIRYTNVAFRGIFVPPGQHRVSMAYSPAIFAVSGALSVVTILGLLALPGTKRRQ